MEKININLIPEEFLVERKQGIKRSLFLRISIIIFVSALIVTSGILLLRLTQSQSLQALEGNLAGKKNGVISLKENETAVFVLKNRLDKITQISAKESTPVEGYNLISTIIPTGANILSFSMTRDNSITATFETKDTQVLDSLFTSLLDPKINKGHITTVKLESIRLQGDKITVDMDIGYSAKSTIPTSPPPKAT